ncbi:YbhB/YbcL family Raf kinase inhibitor-like protein [Mesorhizobium sp. BR1-1-16]|uniref:YbhB/YbcL family Raf kinase inhibitor-like protein n=1 Tax=Mesorhizobium sp. BR1-1-16 TaxID=2876653 RepID=UPI001CCBA0FA|nr:YbhB/YbcL family Raf kinase inhibitor-like protein [Mesorhizobium sp. BR1-1-16]MBZ9936943.1 YbhB/YbcL family Raf kinase inhibitor-like protein [Mesorhizobium sp. BR1-1-16]
MPVRSSVFSVLSMAAVTITAAPVLAQPRGEVGKYSDVVVEGSVLEPRSLDVPSDKVAALLDVPDGFRVSVFADNLINPRMLAVSDAGRLYATRRSVGDVVLIEDKDGDGHAETVRTVASRPGMHGIAFDGERVLLATVNDVYEAKVETDGSFGPLHRIINDLPDAGQHANRTLAIGPDRMLYISVGSTCNACAEPNPENATILRAKPDGSSRTIFGRGLRNTIGFDWEPGTGALYGFDHGIDWLGDQEQVEELNRIEQGRQYGWPYIYGDGQANPQDNPPEGMTLASWAAASEAPMLGYTAHSAPMQMAFYDGTAFPEDYRGDLFVAMRGSWNRRPPSGYEVLRVKFENGRPTRFERFLEGFLIQQQDGSYGYLGRLTGIAVGKDGSLFVADDSNARIFKVAYGSASSAAATTTAKTPNTVTSPAASEIAIKLLLPKDRSGMAVKAPFSDGSKIATAQAADGDNASPAIGWRDTRPDTKSYAVILDDPDAAEPKPFTHWIAYDIPAGVTELREGLPTEPVLQDPKGMKQGMNSGGSSGYQGPKPPVGDPPHHYHLQIFALDVSSLGLKPGAGRKEVLEAMRGHVLAAGEQIGTYKRSGVDNARN